MKKLRKITIILLFIVGFCYLGNNVVGVSHYEIGSEKLPSEFSGMKILQISDLHNNRFGKNQSVILEKINKINPDIIVITGDIVDRNHYDLKPAVELVEGLKKYPVYYVTGNHEYSLSGSHRFKKLEEELRKKNVHILRNKKTRIKKDGAEIEILGTDDPRFLVNSDNRDEASALYQNLVEVKGVDSGLFSVLLSHRSEKIEVYSKVGADLVFSGHSHGGQVRIPLVGGVLAPNQGFFPKYTSGVHNKEGTNLVISRGLGNSVFPFRVLNTPELVVVTIYSE